LLVGYRLRRHLVVLLLMTCDVGSARFDLVRQFFIICRRWASIPHQRWHKARCALASHVGKFVRQQAQSLRCLLICLRTQ
jgi:hypothetical protein